MKMKYNFLTLQFWLGPGKWVWLCGQEDKLAVQKTNHKGGEYQQIHDMTLSKLLGQMGGSKEEQKGEESFIH